MARPRYKNHSANQTYGNALSHSYPMNWEKDKIGGSFADAFNAGYEGRVGGIYRFKRGTVGYLFYQAGRKRKLVDKTRIAT